MKKKVAESEEADVDTFLALMSTVPTHEFVNMISRSNLPGADAAKLCEEFKRLKA